MSKVTPPNADDFAAWRKGQVGEWFFDHYLNEMRQRLTDSWVRAIAAESEKLAAIQRRIVEREDIFSTLIEREYDDICDDLDEKGAAQ